MLKQNLPLIWELQRKMAPNQTWVNSIPILKSETEIEKFWIGIEVSYKHIYHFYHVNTYQYTGTKMIQNFGSFYIYKICTLTMAHHMSV